MMVIALACGACTLAYDSGGFVAGEDPDAGVPTPDADFTQLAIDEIEPDEIFEASGVARPVPVVIRGANIAPDAVVTVSGAGLGEMVLTPAVSADSTMLAFALPVPALDEFAAGDQAALDIVISQGDEIAAGVQVLVRGLPDFVASLDAPEGTVSAADLAPLYATFTVDQPLTVTGAEPFRVVAAVEIAVEAAVAANGGAASVTDAGGGVAGGCDGGNRETPGGCPGSGGFAGGAASGGGGGGHAAVGTGGSGDSAGGGGGSTGSAALVSLAAEGGNGGGGGGDGGLGNGGGGGGGGGAIELTSRGTFRFGDAGAISVTGGPGAAGGGICDLGRGGGGGGGAGGAVLIRAAVEIDDELGTSGLAVDGGSGGGAGCDQGPGGAGAAGRKRVDFPGTDGVPDFAGSSVFRGPSLDPATPAVVTEPTLELHLFGAPGSSYAVEDAALQRHDVVLAGDRQDQSATIDLVPGPNRLCALVTPDVNSSSTEAVQCFTVVYVPQP
jgi:hypothetical protein